MRLTLTTALAAGVLGLAASAAAQPSYDCAIARLNATEKTVCNDTGLAALDQDMARRFYAIFGELDEARKPAFRAEQTQWRRDRDACGAAVGCIRANYVYRIGEFDRMTGGSPPPSAQGIERSSAASVLPDGTIERRWPDGSLTRHLPNGSTERYAADGTRLPDYAFSHVQTAELPPLPPPLENWGLSLQSRLSIILDNILTDAEYSAYQSTEAGKADYVLVDWRLRSISLLTQP